MTLKTKDLVRGMTVKALGMTAMVTSVEPAYNDGKFNVTLCNDDSVSFTIWACWPNDEWSLA